MQIVWLFDFNELVTLNLFFKHPILFLSDKKSERAKDMHLLKRLTVLLKAKVSNPGGYQILSFHL